jgi:beta-lactamase class A
MRTPVSSSRRDFLRTAAGSATLAALPTGVSAQSAAREAEDIPELFEGLPGDVSFKILSPAARGRRQILVQSNPDRKLFVASAIKTFALCEALRQVDAHDVVEKLEERKLVLDSTVWSFGSPTFTPPDISGVVSERTTLEAMVTRSDNTATDMTFKLAGAANIRKFIAAAGLRHTQVPDSTRAFTGYLFGADNYLNLTWEQLQEVVTQPLAHPFLNNVQTLASSADDLVSYYSRALQGAFFRHPETLNEFRRILTLCDFIYLVPLPLGVSAYTKSGNADTAGFHARSIAGAIFVADQWVYFAFVINWYAEADVDPHTVQRFFAAIHTALQIVKRQCRPGPEEAEA